MASILAVLIGALCVVLGGWILLLRSEGFVDFLWPRTLSIGQVTIDGKESKVHAELLRARFDHRFRRPASIPSDTGFLEVATLDAPELFRQKGLDGGVSGVNVQVSGVDVTKIVQFVNELAKPAEWLVEGDFQTRSDRALLALRLRRGPRVIRTWYLDRVKGQSEEQSTLLEKLSDDAIFQLVYDFWNAPESDADLAKWREVIPRPQAAQYFDPKTGRNDIPFPSAAAVAAYYGAQGALGRYYAQGDWKDLAVALEELRTLRVQMPEFVDGLELLGIALAEKREEGEAIHVYEHLGSLLEKQGGHGPSLRRRQLSIALLKATAKAKLFRWQSAHEAVRELTDLAEQLRTECEGAPEKERVACRELLAHCMVQLAYTYALYLDYLTHHTITEVFGSEEAPDRMKISEAERKDLGPDSDKARPVVIKKVTQIANLHRRWLREADEERRKLENLWNALGDKLADGTRRKGELRSRLFLAAGYGSYRMAEWERPQADPEPKVFEKLEEIEKPATAEKLEDFRTFEPIEKLEKATFEALLENAKKELRKADARHPNHYAVLQLLGLVYSDPRDKEADLSVAEQYFERAIRANPFDYGGHELLASILLRRVANRGIEWGSQETIKKGLKEAEEAIWLRDFSYTAHLRHAEFQAMLLVLETNAANRRALHEQLEQYRKQAERFAPRVFKQNDPDLTWVEVVSDTRGLGDAAEGLKGDPEQKNQHFKKSKDALIRKITENLIRDCGWWEQHWVPHQRVVEITKLRQRAQRLQKEIADKNVTLENWDRIQVPFL